ncbi:MAG: LysR family transcriptional regulator [Firmicutes bacterium]|nr:LysR family transcriptional regulator [Bacillota bacterium]
MELISIRYFLEVADKGNMTHAAETLRISQPSLSRHINLIENELGQKLFERDYHTLNLTKAGIEFKYRMENIIQQLDVTIKELSVNKEEFTGSLSVAFMDGALTDTIASAISDFQREYDKITIKYYVGSTNYIKYHSSHKLVDIIVGFLDKPKNSANIINTGEHKTAGIVMTSNDELSVLKSIDAEIVKKISIIGSQWDFDNTDSTPIIPVEKTCTFVEQSGHFLPLINRKGKYMLCIKPNDKLLSGLGLTFVPIVPKIERSICILRPEGMSETNASDAFFKYMNNIFKISA